MTQFLGQFWRKSSAPLLGQHLQKVSGTSAHSSSRSRARKNAIFKAVLCDCGYASPGPSLRHCFWKNKLKKKKISQSSAPSTVPHLLAVCILCARMHLWRQALVSCCWFWSGIMKVGLTETQWKTSSCAFSQLWPLSRVFLVELGCPFMPGELSGKLVLRHHQKPCAHVLILSVFLQEVLNLALQQV